MTTLLCPVCRDTKVEATLPGFAEVHMAVPACSACRERTATISVTFKKSVAIVELTPDPEPMVRHRDGLVWMGGAR